MHNCSPDEKKQGFKDLLNQVRSLMAMNGVSEGGEDKDEYLDPESLVAVSVEGGEDKPESVVSEATAMGEKEADGDDMDDDESDDFDPSEVAEFFSQRDSTPRKQVKSARFSGKA